jgi:hypothetical protein
MSRGLWRWSEGEGDSERLWARVEVGRGQWIDVTKAEYDAQQIEPAYWGLLTRDSYMEDVIDRFGGGGAA